MINLNILSIDTTDTAAVKLNEDSVEFSFYAMIDR